MAHGKTLELQKFDSMMRWRDTPEKRTEPRDRTLRGKARIKARKAARRG